MGIQKYSKLRKLKPIMLKALIYRHGMVKQACKDIGIHPLTFRNWRREDEEYNKAVMRIIKRCHQNIESKLWEHIEAGNIIAIIYYLRTRCYKNGWNVPGEKTPPAIAELYSLMEKAYTAGDHKGAYSYASKAVKSLAEFTAHPEKWNKGTAKAFAIVDEYVNSIDAVMIGERRPRKPKGKHYVFGTNELIPDEELKGFGGDYFEIDKNAGQFFGEYKPNEWEQVADIKGMPFGTMPPAEPHEDEQP